MRPMYLDWVVEAMFLNSGSLMSDYSEKISRRRKRMSKGVSELARVQFAELLYEKMRRHMGMLYE